MRQLEPRSPRPVLLAAAFSLAAMVALLLPAFAPAQTRPNGMALSGPRCFSTLLPEVNGAVGRIIGSREATMDIFSLGDEVLLRTDVGTNVGDTFLVYRVDGSISHPLTGETLGEAVNLVGTVEILDTDRERGIARVTQSCGEVEIGDRLHRLFDAELAMAGALPALDVNQVITISAADAVVVHGSSDSLHDVTSDTGRGTMSAWTNYATGDVVTLDQGSADGWTPGSVAVLYGFDDVATGMVTDSRWREEPIVLAQVVALWVRESTTVALITIADRAVTVGSRARRVGGAASADR